jgi:uncharacterized protein (UPF0335 family)
MTVSVTSVTALVREEIKSFIDEIEALRNDIKEIYDMIVDLQKSQDSSKHLKKMTVEEKILKVHAELVGTARQAGLTKPSN